MTEIKINSKEEIVMNLVHYFVTEKNYNPVIVHGINDEVWLENMHSDYRIIRIISRYIHNNEQLGFNKYRSKQITKKLKLKTLSFKMTVLSIYIDYGDNVKLANNDTNGDLSVFIKNLKDFQKNQALIEVFPDIIEKTNHHEKGIDLLFKITDDINVTNEKKNKKMEKIFSTKKPIITYILIAISLLMFIISSGGYNIEKLVLLGANYGPLVKEGEIYRLIACMFLHAGIIHIALNMYSLYIIGPKVEDFFGKWKYLIIYFLSGLSSSLLSIALGTDAVSVGASGAIFGLFGALIYFGYSYRGYIGSMIKGQMITIVIYNLLMGFLIPGIDMWGHIGGLIGGLLTASMLGTIENKKYNWNYILVSFIYFAFLIYLGIFN